MALKRHTDSSMSRGQQYTPQYDITYCLHLFQKLFSYQILACFHNAYPLSYVSKSRYYVDIFMFRYCWATEKLDDGKLQTEHFLFC